MRTFLRRVKGAVGNALVWGFVWFWLGAGVSLLFRLPGGFAGGAVSVLLQTLMAGIVAGVFGAAIGGGFSLFIATNFRHQSIESVNPGRFALGGGLVTAAAVLITTYAAGPNGLIDRALVDPSLFYGTLAMQTLIAGAVGGLTAYGTIRLAQRGAELEQLEGS